MAQMLQVNLRSSYPNTSNIFSEPSVFPVARHGSFCGTVLLKDQCFWWGARVGSGKICPQGTFGSVWRSCGLSQRWGYYRHLMGRDQGGCYTSCNAQSSPPSKNSSSPKCQLCQGWEPLTRYLGVDYAYTWTGAARYDVSGIRHPWVQTSALPCSTSKTLNKFLNFSEP